MTRSLTQRQIVFAREYAKHGNGAEAARRAGYSVRTARFIAHENLQKPNIIEAVSRERRNLFSEGMSPEASLLDRLVEMAKARIADMFDINGVPLPIDKWPEPFQCGLVRSFSIKEKLVFIKDHEPFIVRRYRFSYSDRTKILKLIGNHKFVRAFIK